MISAAAHELKDLTCIAKMSSRRQRSSIPTAKGKLGRHKLLCGDARRSIDFEALLGKEEVDLDFTDPPYTVKIDGNVCGLGWVKHREFAFASSAIHMGDPFLTR